MKIFKVVKGGKSYKIAAKDAATAINSLNKIKSVEDERLSPMTYSKLKEMGYSHDDWKDLTQEQANKIVAEGKATKENAAAKFESKQESPKAENKQTSKNTAETSANTSQSTGSYGIFKNTEVFNKSPKDMTENDLDQIRKAAESQAAEAKKAYEKAKKEYDDFNNSEENDELYRLKRSYNRGEYRSDEERERLKELEDKDDRLYKSSQNAYSILDDLRRLSRVESPKEYKDMMTDLLRMQIYEDSDKIYSQIEKKVRSDESIPWNKRDEAINKMYDKQIRQYEKEIQQRFNNMPDVVRKARKVLYTGLTGD